MTNAVMRQAAPFPQVLADLLGRLTYEPGGRTWRFTLADKDRGQGSKGLTLVINITGPDSYSDRTISVNHYMLVPPAAYNERSWRRWLFDQIGLVELHERMEFFKIDGRPAHPPAHGHGNDPYLLLEYGSDTDRRTSFRNVLDDDGTGRSRTVPPVISAALAAELDGYRGRWVAIINQHVVSDGGSPEEAIANQPGAVPGFKGPVDPLILRVPERALAAFLGIGQS